MKEKGNSLASKEHTGRVVDGRVELIDPQMYPFFKQVSGLDFYGVCYTEDIQKGSCRQVVELIPLKLNKTEIKDINSGKIDKINLKFKQQILHLK